MNERLKVTRTLGFEVECFVDCDPDDMYVPYAEIGYDGSLHGGGGRSECEVKTDPISNLNVLEDVYKHLNNNDMYINNSCGLHIHVDTSDYTAKDKVKLLRFCAGIELLMYSLVDEYRSRSEYCEKLHKGWRKIFRNNFINNNEEIPFDSFGRSLTSFERWVQDHSSHRDGRNIWNGRYQWMNAQVGHAPTCEFRIFSPTTDYSVAQKFGMLAYHIIETVKNSTIEQIQFIIKSVYRSQSVDEMLEKLFDSIGLDSEFRPTVLNHSMESYIDTTYCLPRRQQATSQSQAV